MTPIMLANAGIDVDSEKNCLMKTCQMKPIGRRSIQ